MRTTSSPLRVTALIASFRQTTEDRLAVREVVEAHGKHGRRIDYERTNGDYADLEGALVFRARRGSSGSMISTRRFFDSNTKTKTNCRLPCVESSRHFRKAADPKDA
jgi:hypothetical protein